MSGLYPTNFVYSIPQAMPPREWHSSCLGAFRTAWGSHSEGQFVYIIGAGVGSGKTCLASLLAYDLLSRREIDRVIFVCPNRLISRRVIDTFLMFGIHLSDWSNDKHVGRGGEGAAMQGAVLTYASLARKKCRRLQRQIANNKRHLVIFDEMHHLGDRKPWSDAATEAFQTENVAVVGMSGTWYRSDNHQVAFGRYVEPEGSNLRHLYCDYTYTLGRAVVDLFCKRPSFQWLEGEVQIAINGEPRIYSMSNPPPPELSRDYLRAAVAPGSASRREALKIVVDRCLRENRKLIIFVGGDTRSRVGACDDATEILPLELQAIGVPAEAIVSVVSDDGNARTKIEAFGKSNAWILITVNMVSEGVDIPELSAALFLSSVTATATTVQRIGRVIRGCDPPQALIFMFWHPRYVALAQQIEDEITQELRDCPKRKARDEVARGESIRIEAVGIAAREGGVTLGGRTYTRDQVNAARKYAVANNHPLAEATVAVILTMLYPQGGVVC